MSFAARLGKMVFQTNGRTEGKKIGGGKMPKKFWCVRWCSYLVVICLYSKLYSNCDFIYFTKGSLQFQKKMAQH